MTVYIAIIVVKDHPDVTILAMNDPEKSFLRCRTQELSNSEASIQNNVVILQPSQAVIEHRGKRRTPNTERNARTGVNAWCSVQLKHLISLDSPIAKQSDEWIMNQLKTYVMPDAKRGETLFELSLQNLNVSLGEFVMHCRQSNGTHVSPGTLLVYLQGISRWLRENWVLQVDMMHDDKFKNKHTGYLQVADRIAADQQAKGIRIKPHNSLTDNDVEKTLTHSCTSTKYPVGYVSRATVIVGLFLGLRYEALRKLSWSMFHDKIDDKGKPCIRYEGIIGSYEGESKIRKEGFSAAKSLPVSIILFDKELAFGINPYNFIIAHRKKWFATENKKDFFLSPNYGMSGTSERSSL